jgi:hypothetical protein
VSIASRGRDGGGGDLEGWKSARAWVGGGESVHLASRRSPRAVSDVSRGAGVPDPRPLRRGRHGVADASIGLENYPAPFGTHRCEPKNHAGPQNAIGTAIGRASRDALRIRFIR